METEYCIGIHSQTATAEARRVAMQLASSLGFDETEAGNLALVVTEASKNLLKHGGGGDLLLRAIDNDGASTVEIIAIDKGPGMVDVTASFADGYSTAGTSGTGLGAISRLSTFHDIYSQPRQGTALLAHISRRSAPHASRVPRAGFRVGGVAVPKPGETVNGDAWVFHESVPGVGRLVMADGLGHGLFAADAARAAVRVAREYLAETPARLMERLHEVLRPTRGAAVAIADIDSRAGLVRYTGVGNITASILPPGSPVRHAVSHPGTVGHEVRKIAEFTYPWERGSVLIMHSDGLLSHWSLERYPGVLSRHPSLIAAILYRDFIRGRDDASVAAVRESEEAA